MLRINQQTNAAAVKSYHSSPAEYYRPGEQEIVGQWGGKAADRLGLAGEVLRPHFERLCDNRHPFTREQLTARMRKDRRIGYDFTFDASKSVSILYGLTGDSVLLDAFRSAVRATLEEMEAGVKARVRKFRQFAERIVGNMAWGEFIHFTARPVKGEIDPHLHAHAFVANACWDHVEHAWKAIDVASLKENGPYWQARFQKRFGKRLAELGYNVAWSGDNFEIAGISRSLIDRFSRRTTQINQAAEQRGITDAKAKDKLGALTREHKRKDATLPELRLRWYERLSDIDRIAIAQAARRRPLAPRNDRESVARLTTQPIAATAALDAWEQQRREFIRQRQRRAMNDQRRASEAPPPGRSYGR
ncbi:MAG TPA: MobF family relaxase [Steroidobacteraceae bacterium]